MKREFIIHAKGNVAVEKKAVYSLKAESEKQAIELAKKNFAENNIVVGENLLVCPESRMKYSISACILLLIPIIMSFIQFSSDGFLWWNTKTELRPGLKSIALACAFVAAYILRFKGLPIKSTNDSWSWVDWVLLVELIFVVSAFLQVILKCNEKSIIGGIIYKLLGGPTTFIIIGAVLSFIGMKLASVASLFVVVLLSLGNIDKINETMGIWGALFIIAAFLGIILFLCGEPKAQEIIDNFSKGAKRKFQQVKIDVSIAGARAKEITGAFIPVATDKTVTINKTSEENK